MFVERNTKRLVVCCVRVWRNVAFQIQIFVEFCFPVEYHYVSDLIVGIAGPSRLTLYVGIRLTLVVLRVTPLPRSAPS